MCVCVCAIDLYVYVVSMHVRSLDFHDYNHVYSHLRINTRALAHANDYLANEQEPHLGSRRARLVPHNRRLPAVLLALRNGLVRIAFASNAVHGSALGDSVTVADAVASFAVIICSNRSFPCAIFGLRGARCIPPSRPCPSTR